MALVTSFAFPGQVFGGSADIEAFLKAEAAEAMAKYPQYAGHFDGYRLGRAKRTVRTKMGVAVEKGELVIFKTEKDEGWKILRGEDRMAAVFWSRTNRCDTMVLADEIEPV